MQNSYFGRCYIKGISLNTGKEFDDKIFRNRSKRHFECKRLGKNLILEEKMDAANFDILFNIRGTII